MCVITTIMKSIDGQPVNEGLFCLATCLIGVAIQHGYNKQDVITALSSQWDRQSVEEPRPTLQ